MGWRSIFPAARICSAERPRWRGILVRRLTAQGLQARVAIADTVGCAWGVARFSPSPRKVEVEPNRVGVSLGGERDAIAPLPLAALRLPAETIEALSQVGLKRIADVLDRPRAPLAARFGAEFVRRIDQALGREDEPIAPRLPIPAAITEQRFAEPIALERDVLGTIEKLAGKLGALLERRGEGARLLQAALFRTDGKVFRIEVGTSEPLREPARIRHLFADRLGVIGDEVDPGFGYDMLRLAALVTERSEAAQTGLAQPDHAAELAHLIDRLGARFGLRRVTRFVKQDTHIPEFAVMAVGAAVSALPAQAGIDLPSAGSPLSAFAKASADRGRTRRSLGEDGSRGRAELRKTPTPPPVPSVSSHARSQSKPSPKYRTGLRCGFAGAMCCTRWRMWKGPSASRWNGGAMKRATCSCAITFASKAARACACGCFARGQSRRKDEEQEQDQRQQPTRWFLHGVFA